MWKIVYVFLNLCYFFIIVFCVKVGSLVRFMVMVKEFVYIDYVIFFDFEIRYILC